jgi:hypothetical protein
MKSPKRVAGLVFVAVAVAVLAATSAYAQGAPGGIQGQGQGGQGQQFRQMAGMMQPAPAIAVADGFVFVVYGNTLYQFSIDGLKLVNQYEFPRPARGNRGGGGPQGPAAGAPQ